MPEIRARRRRMLVEQLDRRQMLAADLVNPGNQLDVNDDLSVTPIDALLVINTIARGGPGLSAGPDAQPPYVNVNGDDVITPIDALVVLNALNRRAPEVAVRLALDTDHDGGTSRDRKTFHVAVDGKVNFPSDTPQLYVGVGATAPYQWMDASEHVGADGRFTLQDDALRALYGGSIPKGQQTLKFSGEADGSLFRDLDIELLDAPPLPRLVVAEVTEDGEVLLDLEGEAYDPDSDASAIDLTILAQPVSGQLQADGDAFIYRPEENFHGVDHVVYEVSDETQTLGATTLTITIESVNDEPELMPVEDKVIDVVDGILEIPFSAGDADGDTLQYLGYASVPNPLAEIRDTYNLVYAGDDYFNLTGLNEKWLFQRPENASDLEAEGEQPDPPKALFMLPSGDLVQWQGDYQSTGTRESLIARLSPEVYDDLERLWKAPNVLLAPVHVHVQDDMIVLVPEEGLQGEVDITVLASDGELETSQQFKVMIDQDDQAQQIGDLLSSYINQAATLSYESIPDFIGQLSSDLDKFDPPEAAELSGLLRQLTTYYLETQSTINQSVRWNDAATAQRELDMRTVSAIQDEFAVLKSEFDEVWELYQPFLADPQPTVDDQPIFITPKDFSKPVQAYAGEKLVLDFRQVVLGNWNPNLEILSYPSSFGFEEFGRPVVESFNPGGPSHHRFEWVPKQAGTFDFTVGARMVFDGGSQFNSIDFTVEVLPNAAHVESLTIDSTAVAASGQEVITLTANGVFNPRQDVSRVEFYQDADGDGILDLSFDAKLRNEDADGADGWSIATVPFPVENADTVTFFARAIIESEVEDPEFILPSEVIASISEPVAVTVPVLHEAELDVNVLSPQGDPVVLGNSPVFPVTYPNALSTYGDRDAIRLELDSIRDDETGIFYERALIGRRFRDVDFAGFGNEVGEKFLVDERRDSEGTIVQAEDDGSFSVMFLTAEQDLTLLRYDPDNNEVERKVIVSFEPDIETSPVFTFGMNSGGQGVIAWSLAQTLNGPPIENRPNLFIQPFTGGGAELGALHEINHEAFPPGNREPNGLYLWRNGTSAVVDVNEFGQYVISWPNHIAYGSVLVPDPPALKQFEFDDPLVQSRAAAINDQGWMAILQSVREGGNSPQKLSLIDPNGRKVGQSVRHELSGINSGQRSYDLQFLEANQLQLLWNEINQPSNPTHKVHSNWIFDLAIHSDLQADSIAIQDATIQAGQTINVEYTISNAGATESSPVDVAIYFSRDEIVDSSDRLLATATTSAGIDAGGTSTFTTTVTLPAGIDPILVSAEAPHQLVMQIIGSESTATSELPYLQPELISETTGPTNPLPVWNLVQNPGHRYINPDVFLSQINDDFEFHKSLDLMQIIGYQFVEAGKELAVWAPADLQIPINSAVQHVQTQVDLLVQELIDNKTARSNAISAAKAVRDAEIAASEEALAQEIAKIDAENLLLRTPVEAAKSVQEAIYTSLYNMRETKRLNREISKTQKQLDGLDGSEADIEVVDQQLESEFVAFGFTTDTWVGQRLEKAAGDTTSCIGDADACGAQFVSDVKEAGRQLSEYYKERRDELTSRLQPYLDQLNNELANVDSLVRDLVEQAVKPLQDVIDTINNATSTATKTAENAQKAVEETARSTYGKAETQINNNFEEAIEVVKALPQRALGDVSDNLTDVIETISGPTGVLATVTDALEQVDQHNPFGSVTDILEEAKDFGNVAINGLTDLKDKIDPVDALIEARSEFSDWASETGGVVSNWIVENGGTVADWITENIGDALDEEVIAIKAASDFEFSLNLTNGSSFLEANITPTISYDSKKFGDLLNGDFPFPDVDLLATAGEFYGVRFVKTNNYEEVRKGLYDQHGPQNVYFASDRFVNYFGAETASAAAAELVVTQGESAEALLKEIAEQIRLEFNDILSWLGQKGQQQLESMIPDLINAVITQTPVDLPELGVQFTPVTFTYSVEPTGLAGKYLDIVESVTGEEISIERLAGGRPLGVEVPSLGFSLIWKEPEGIDPLLPENIDLELSGDLDTFNFGEFSEPGLTGDLIDIAIAELEPIVSDDVMDILNVMTGVINGAAGLQARIAADVSAALGLDAQLVLENYINGNPIVDLSGTPAAAQFNDLLAKITLGNQGSVEPRKFTLNLSTMVLEIDGTLCHKHSWGTIGDLIRSLTPGL